MAILIDDDLKWLEGPTFRDRVGPGDAEMIRKICATYRAAVTYLRELDARRDGDARGRELVNAEIELRQAIWMSLPNERVIAGLRALHDDITPPPGWDTNVESEIAARRRSWWQRFLSYISWSRKP